LLPIQRSSRTPCITLSPPACQSCATW
jgi:hypothetical protein